MCIKYYLITCCPTTVFEAKSVSGNAPLFISPIDTSFSGGGGVTLFCQQGWGAKVETSVSIFSLYLGIALICSTPSYFRKLNYGT